ncbi:MAG: hypothetical protein KN64_14990 [Sulfurovum sp. AS07-7]|nr:MAG: hypothetical protein KN64_14990 [Sulfurovum sp. AS07-7]
MKNLFWRVSLLFFTFFSSSLSASLLDEKFNCTCNTSGYEYCASDSWTKQNLNSAFAYCQNSTHTAGGGSVNSGDGFYILGNGTTTYKDIAIAKLGNYTLSYNEAVHTGASGKVTLEYLNSSNQVLKTSTANFSYPFKYVSEGGDGKLSSTKSLDGGTTPTGTTKARIKLYGTKGSVGFAKVDNIKLEIKEDIPTCDVKADIWYANDESGSIDATEFSQSKTFLNEIAKRFRYSAVDGVQSSLIGWAYNPKMRINLTSDYKNQLLSYTQKLGGGTRPHIVTDYVATLIKNKTGRADAGQVMVLLTDANSNQILESWVDAANRFRANTTNSKIVVVLIAEAATAYRNEPAKKSIVDRVIGENGLVIVTDSYANIVDPANNYIKNVSNAICEASKQKDFGDVLGYSNPSQAVSSYKNVFIGNTVDGEIESYSSANASGDDTNGTDDEDGVASAQTLVAGQAYALNLKVTNKEQSSGDFPVIMSGWIDFNGDKQFQSNEKNIGTIVVNEGVLNETRTLTWNVPENAQGGNAMMRLRLGAEANPDENSLYEGEVEDHLVGINGTQSLFNIERTNSVKNAKDYNLYTQIAGRDFDYSLVSYADESFSVEKVISDTTVKVELVDFGANEAVLYSRYIYIPTGNKTGRINVINAEDLKNIRATKEAKFRISYPKNAQGYIINGDFSTDAKFNILSKEISYSKDSFAIRPAGFVVDIVDGTTKLKDNISVDALRLTSGYKYNLNAKAINSAGVATANYNTTVTDSSLAFNDSASCSVKDSYPLNIDFTSGNGTPKELKSANSGKYKIKLKDKAWTQVDSSGGCIANSSLISADGNTLSGCDISSDFSNNNVTYKNNDITFYPAKFDVSDFNAINENGSTHSDFLYMNNLNPTDADDKMALAVFGKVIAKNYEDEPTTNFTAGCSNEDVTIKLKYNGQSDAGAFGNDGATTTAEVIKSIKNSTPLFFTNKYTLNGKVSMQNGLSTDIVAKAEDIKDGEIELKMLYNIARIDNDEINPVKVALKSLDVSSPTSSSTSANQLKSPIGSKIFDNVEKTFYYARIFPDRNIYPITYDGSEDTPLYAEIFCLKDTAFCSKMMGTNGLNGARTQLGWYGSIHHDNSVDGKVLEIKKTALNSDMVSIVGSFNEFVNGKIQSLTTNYSGKDTMNSKVDITKIDAWLKVEDQYWINQFRQPATRNFSGVGKTGKIVKPAPSGVNLRKIDW